MNYYKHDINASRRRLQSGQNRGRTFDVNLLYPHATPMADSEVTVQSRFYKRVLNTYCILFDFTDGIDSNTTTTTKKDWQCKAGRGRLIPHQSDDHQLIEEKKRKGK